MTEIDNLLDMINDDVRCQIIPVFGEMNSLPDDKLIYPEDVVYFYSRCNGVNLFSKDRTKILFSILPKEKYCRQIKRLLVRRVMTIYLHHGI